MEKQTIFLADDDKDDRMLFTEALSMLPFDLTVKTFDNGVDLMANLLNDKMVLPNLIFLDLNMPLMNGEECLDDIRREPRFFDVPVIIYSGFLDLEQASFLQKKGANHYLRKPSNFKNLIALLKKAIITIQSKETENGFVLG